MKHQTTTTELSTVAKDILASLEEEPRQSPKMMKNKLSYGLASIKSSLVTLNQLHLVTQIARGLYEITDLGKTVLHHPDQSSRRTE